MNLNNFLIKAGTYRKLDLLEVGLQVYTFCINKEIIANRLNWKKIFNIQDNLIIPMTFKF